MYKIIIVIAMCLFSVGCSTSSNRTSLGYGMIGGSIVVGGAVIAENSVASSRVPDGVDYNWEPMIAVLCTSVVLGVVGYALTWSEK